MKGNFNITMGKDNKITKKDFLNMLTTFSVKEMQKFIEEKGKEPKSINPIMHDRN